MGCGSDTTVSTTFVSEEGARVHVYVVDAPDPDYESVFVKIHEVTLIPGDGGGRPIVLFESARGREVDLLDLRDERLLLAACPDVRPGTYSKIRLRISDPRVVGGPCEELALKVPSGKVDLVPRDPISVARGDLVSITLDLDAPKSVHLHQAGKSGKCIFRPVVFTDIVSGPLPCGCLRTVDGTIVERVIRDGELVGFFLDVPDHLFDLEVRLRDDTAIFALDGEPADTSAVEVGLEAHVRGRMTGAGSLEAYAVALGEVISVRGLVESPVEDGRFRFTPGPSQELEGTRDVEVTDETFILLGCDVPVEPEAILPGMRASIVGKLVAEEGSFRALFVHVWPVALRGDLTSVTASGADRVLALRVGGDTDRSTDVSLVLPADRPLQFTGGVPLPSGLLTELLECRTVPVRIHLEPDRPGVAESVEVLGERLSGDIAVVVPQERRIRVDERWVEVLGSAPVLDLRSDPDRPGALEGATPGDAVIAFGLEGCGESGADFHAASILWVSEEFD